MTSNSDDPGPPGKPHDPTKITNDTQDNDDKNKKPNKADDKKDKKDDKGADLGFGATLQGMREVINLSQEAFLKGVKSLFGATPSSPSETIKNENISLQKPEEKGLGKNEKINDNITVGRRKK